MAAIICQLVVSSIQYAWTLFVDPIDAQHHWGRPAIQAGFSILVLTQSFLMPVVGHAMDRFTPRPLMVLGGVLVGLSWLIMAAASSLPALYLGAVIGGLAYALVPGVAAGHALKWFPDRRGIAVGVTSGAFAAGTVLTAIPIANTIRDSGYEAALVRFGTVLSVSILTAAALLVAPGRDHDRNVASPRVRQNSQHLTPRQALASPIFYLLYGLFTMVCTGGLFLTAQMATMARDFHVAMVPVSLWGIAMAALPFALSFSRLLDGLGRPFFGWVSDHLGRENTLVVAFLVEAGAIAGLLVLGRTPVMFVLLSGLVAFAWGQIFSVFPALVGDLFGQKFVTTIWGLLWTGKGLASLLVPLGSWLVARTGTWAGILTLTALLNVGAAVLALQMLKPVCARALSHSVLPARSVAGGTENTATGVGESPVQLNA